MTDRYQTLPEAVAEAERLAVKHRRVIIRESDGWFRVTEFKPGHYYARWLHRHIKGNNPFVMVIETLETRRLDK